MKILLIAVGKTDNKLISQLIDEYIKRINFYIPIELNTLPDVKKSKNLSEKEQKTLEGNSIKKFTIYACINCCGVPCNYS